MFLIPVEDRIDWRRPPWLCLLLIAANTLLFAWSSSHDQRVLERLTNTVDTELLTDYEWPLWLRYTDDAAMVTLDARYREQVMLYRGWMDREFDAAVHAHWATEAPPAAWQEARSAMARQRGQISWLRWGLTPAEPTLTTLFSSQFMHGGVLHLVGNMAFLLLFGFPLERRWGATRLLGLYLTSGLGAGAAFILFFPNSMIPLVGASGAIAGLMGIYVATYRHRRVEFFYTLGFVFGSFRASALMVFPLWFGWELVQHFTSVSNVAYMAHAGGLVTGLGLAMLWQTLQPNIIRPGDEPAAAALPDDALPAGVLRLAESLEFGQALALAQQHLTRTPDHMPLRFFEMDTAAQLDHARLQHSFAASLKARHARQISDAQLSQLWRHFHELGGDDVTLPPPYRLMLAELCLRRRDWRQSRALATTLRDQDNWQHPRLERLLQQLAGEVSSGTSPADASPADKA
ncbi:rhomboid family intramembrane serine protease [Alcanivorax sp. JB21]|uniref:rhomboid family intramembrane serine protease n=1 Tax=Alcanivorax limicola TaxID=2874102 RepID=UPI001CBEA687|nr:rhomboid family intramembrane serine protease [Alcanivorax limicola]MBZ2188325.1 rhomboid family intramembrane serine protease [Alcanivorax limicola]